MSAFEDLKYMKKIAHFDKNASTSISARNTIQMTKLATLNQIIKERTTYRNDD